MSVCFLNNWLKIVVNFKISIKKINDNKLYYIKVKYILNNLFKVFAIIIYVLYKNKKEIVINNMSV